MAFKEDRKRNIYDIVRVAHNDIDLWSMILFAFANNDMIFPTFSRKRKYHCVSNIIRETNIISEIPL